MTTTRRLHVVDMAVAPEPPYPADTEANGYKPMVDWQRIKSSKSWRLCPPELRNALLRLWLESWNEVPAGSWEDDDELIAAAIDVTPVTLRKHRVTLLRGWVRHSDGRLYHKFITEQVFHMCEKRKDTNEANRERQARWRERKRQERERELEESVTQCPVTETLRNAQDRIGRDRIGLKKGAKAPSIANAIVDFDQTKLDESSENLDSSKPADETPVRSVFSYWRQVAGHPTAKLDAKRKRAIAGRLKDGFSVEDLKRAIDGCKASDWHQGKNQGSKVYDDVELICRNASNVERFQQYLVVGTAEASRLDAWLNEDKPIEGECERVET